MARNNPAAPVMPGEIVRLTLQLKTQSTLQQIVLDYTWSNANTRPTLADLQAFETAWEAATNAKLLACLSPLSSYSQVSVAEISEGATPTLVLPFAAGTVGTAGATNLPLEMAAVLVKRTSLKGQHGRGRVSMPAVPNTFTTPATDPNVVNAAGTTAYIALANQLITPVAAGGNTWSLIVATAPVAPETRTVRGVIVTLITLDSVLGTIRRRKPGRGI